MIAGATHETPPLEGSTYLPRYLEVFNRALAATRHRFPFHAVLAALEDELVGRCVRVVLLDGVGRGELVDWDLDGSRFEVTAGPDRKVAGHWPVAGDHVRDVLRRPWRYLADPMLFELPPFTLCGPTPKTCRPAGSRHVDDCIPCRKVES